MKKHKLHSRFQHLMLEFYGCNADLLDNEKHILQALKNAANKAQMTTIGEISHKFTPQGVTAVVLLAESHISMHTYPEYSFAIADIFACNDGRLDECAESLQHAVQARKTKSRVVTRGFRPQANFLQKLLGRSYKKNV